MTLLIDDALWRGVLPEVELKVGVKEAFIEPSQAEVLIETPVEVGAI